MREVYVCIPVQVKDKVLDTEARLCIVPSRSHVTPDIHAARGVAAGMWGQDPCDLVVVVHVDEILNVSLTAVFGWHRIGSRYDLPGSVAQTDMAVYDLAVEARLRADEYINAEELI